METLAIANKIDLLPEIIQQQLVDYIDFLTQRHTTVEKGAMQKDDFVLTDELKDVFDYRLAHHKKNKHKAKPAEEVINNLAKKYNYEL